MSHCPPQRAAAEAGVYCLTSSQQRGLGGFPLGLAEDEPMGGPGQLLFLGHGPEPILPALAVPAPAAPGGFGALVGQLPALFQIGIQIPGAPIVPGAVAAAVAAAAGGGGGGGAQEGVVGGVAGAAPAAGLMAGAGGAATAATAAAAAAAQEMPALVQFSEDSDDDDSDGSLPSSDDGFPPLHSSEGSVALLDDVIDSDLPTADSEDVSDHHSGSDAGDGAESAGGMPILTSGDEFDDGVPPLESQGSDSLYDSEDESDSDDGLSAGDGTVDIDPTWTFNRASLAALRQTGSLSAPAATAGAAGAAAGEAGATAGEAGATAGEAGATAGEAGAAAGGAKATAGAAGATAEAAGVTAGTAAAAAGADTAGAETAGAETAAGVESPLLLTEGAEASAAVRTAAAEQLSTTTAAAAEAEVPLPPAGAPAGRHYISAHQVSVRRLKVGFETFQLAHLPHDPATGRQHRLCYITRTNKTWFCVAAALAAEYLARSAGMCGSVARTWEDWGAGGPPQQHVLPLGAAQQPLLQVWAAPPPPPPAAAAAGGLPQPHVLPLGAGQQALLQLGAAPAAAAGGLPQPHVLPLGPAQQALLQLGAAPPAAAAGGQPQPPPVLQLGAAAPPPPPPAAAGGLPHLQALQVGAPPPPAAAAPAAVEGIDVQACPRRSQKQPPPPPVRLYLTAPRNPITGALEIFDKLRDLYNFRYGCGKLPLSSTTRHALQQDDCMNAEILRKTAGVSCHHSSNTSTRIRN